MNGWRICRTSRRPTRPRARRCPWFSPQEYKQLYETTRAQAKVSQIHHRWSAERLHELFLANTGLRSEEAKNLRHRD